MKQFLVIIFFLIFISKAYSQQSAQAPKLVVGIVVDQMRYDYIHRYWNKFSDKGFRKIVRTGYWCKDTKYNYVPTYTGPGHASIYTGTTPERHGIIANDWFDRSAGKMVYCSGDASVNTIGCEYSDAGKMSPHRMITSTVGDELKLATVGKSKVFGIALKDRGAILPAGHAANAAFWFDSKCGNWISSSFYMSELPQWLVNHNNEKLPQKFISQTWNTLLPLTEYTESLPDENAYEQPFKGQSKAVFPYNLSELKDKNDGFEILKFTPYGNTLTRKLAEALIKGENLGKSNYTDFLAVSFSSTDYVGHKFGISSVELQDTYLQLDLELAALMDFINKQVGSTNVLYFLTADHAGVEVPAYQKSLKIPGGYIDYKTLESQLNEIAKAKWGLDKIVLSISNEQVYLDRTLIESKNLSLESVQNELVQVVLNYESIFKASTSIQLERTNFTDGLEQLIDKGFMWQRSGDIAFIPFPNYINYKNKGTTHGSPFVYDTRVPLLFWGWKVKQGETTQTVFINDIAPTLSNMLNIMPPNGSNGSIISVPLKK